MISLLAILEQVNIEEKIKEAPDDSYEIGVFIGSFLPFVVLVVIAYAIYKYNKKNQNTD